MLRTTATGYTIFEPKFIKSKDGTVGTLTSVDFVSVDDIEQRVQAFSILGAPLDLPVGNLVLSIEQRVSKNGNQLNWYKAHKLGN